MQTTERPLRQTKPQIRLTTPSRYHAAPGHVRSPSSPAPSAAAADPPSAELPAAADPSAAAPDPSAAAAAPPATPAAASASAAALASSPSPTQPPVPCSASSLSCHSSRSSRRVREGDWTSRGSGASQTVVTYLNAQGRCRRSPSQRAACRAIGVGW